MKARNSLILIIVFLMIGFGATMLSAQQQENQEEDALEGVGEPDAEELGVDSAQQKLRTVSVSKFEDAGFWEVSMPLEQGLITMRTLPGSPIDKEPLEGEQEAGVEEPDRNVLGVKIQYYRRGHNQFAVFPVRPLPIEGISKTVSVWVVGRNSPHVLKLIVSDQFGNRGEITMGELNFTGWKKLTAAVPRSFKQVDYHYSNRQGISIEGFRIDCDPEETFGTYYLYFDALRATTDLFSEESRDVDDMPDNW